MKKRVELDSNEWFKLKDQKEDGVKFYVMTGARGCGKTVSVHNEIRKLYKEGKTGLYIRNSRHDIATARQYFSFLAEERGENYIVNLGSLGASTVVMENRENKGDVEKDLIAYTLFIADYETLKSAKRKIDYIVYEEFSSFVNGSSINRIFALTEIIETISQTVPNFIFYAISNNIYEDDLFDNLLDEDEFIHCQIIKKTIKNGIKNAAIKHYLEGEYLVPDIVINLARYKCLGFVMIAKSKLYVFNWDLGIPKYVISSTGSGNKLPLDTETINIISQASYRSLKDRNKCEFLVGLVRFSGVKLKT